MHKKNVQKIYKNSHGIGNLLGKYKSSNWGKKGRNCILSMVVVTRNSAHEKLLEQKKWILL